MGHQETDLGENIEGALPGYGRTFDEAIEDAYHKGQDMHGSEPGWYKIDATFVLIENPIREYKVIITPGS